MKPPIFGKAFIAMASGIMYINAVARHQGYGIAIKSHKTENHEKVRIYLRCSLGRLVKSVAKLRKTSTKMTNCPFEISLNYHSRSDRWIVQQDQKTASKHHHNHGPFDQPHNQSKNRRFNSEILRQMDLLSSAGCRAGQI